MIGPDAGVRWNLRLGRFVKSYTRFLPWTDQHYYLQAQTYWILDCLELYDITGSAECLENAGECANVVAARQNSQGYWEYPKTDWAGVINTVEGCFGGLGLLAAHGVLKDDRYLAGARRWYEFMIERVGFQRYDDDSLAVNYFANTGRGMVPNNSTLAMWFAAALSKATGEDRYMEHCRAMLNFLARCQLDSGELPYSIRSEMGPGRTHYLCFQDNAFQFLDLAHYYSISKDEAAVPVMRKLSAFLSEGLTSAGDARYNCDNAGTIVHYFTSAVSAALLKASEMGLGDYARTAERGYSRLLSAQRQSGGFDYS